MKRWVAPVQFPIFPFLEADLWFHKSQSLRITGLENWKKTCAPVTFRLLIKMHKEKPTITCNPHTHKYVYTNIYSRNKSFTKTIINFTSCNTLLSILSCLTCRLICNNSMLQPTFEKHWARLRALSPGHSWINTDRCFLCGPPFLDSTRITSLLWHICCPGKVTIQLIK